MAARLFCRQLHTTREENMKKIFGVCFFVAVLSLVSSTAFAGSSVNHWYLYPAETGVQSYPDGVAKLTFNASTGDYSLRGHGLEAGMTYEVRSGGDFGEVHGVAVGNGDSGLGNNVLIKGNVFDQEIDYCDQLGAKWNLWVSNTGEEPFVKVLITAVDDVSPADFCAENRYP
jgi:hypothetical protein